MAVSDRPLHVGVDACPLAPGRTGVGNYVESLLLELCEQHPEVKFTLFANSTVAFPDFPNVAIRAVPSRLRGPLWQSVVLGRLIRRNKVQVFWGSNGYLPPYRMPRVATVVTVHDLAEIFAPDTQARLVRFGRRILQPRAVRIATRVIAVSRATAADIASIYGRRVHEVVAPLVSSRFKIQAVNADEIRNRYKLPQNYLLTVGTLEPRKNLGSLIAAYVDRRRKDVQLPPLVIVGGAGWRDEGIKSAVESAEESGWVRRLGFVPSDDLPALYGGCDVFFMPSIYEGFGMPLVEAQLCGAAVVHGAHPAMVEAAGGVGIAIDPTEENLCNVLDGIATGRCPLACRVPSTIPNDPAAAARLLWQQISEAWSECGQETVNGVNIPSNVKD